LFSFAVHVPPCPSLLPTRKLVPFLCFCFMGGSFFSASFFAGCHRRVGFFFPVFSPTAHHPFPSPNPSDPLFRVHLVVLLLETKLLVFDPQSALCERGVNAPLFVLWQQVPYSFPPTPVFSPPFLKRLCFGSSSTKTPTLLAAPR